ncbi:MAG: hypothetical protein HGJ94_18365 [Desulfosarcina sp.]|nr:hypothetical protein [Desulfosarcina sp.]
MAFVACSEGGLTDVKLSNLFDVSKSTITRWKNEFPEFWASIKRGKDIFDCATAETCLLKRIKGYRYSEVTREPVPVYKDTPVLDEDGIQFLDEDGNPVTKKVVVGVELAITKKVSKSVAPDVKAITFFLTNRNPDRWKMIKHVELTGKEGGPIGVKVDPWEEMLKSVTKANSDELPNKSGRSGRKVRRQVVAPK